MSERACPLPEGTSSDLLGRRADREVFPELDRGWPRDGFGPISTVASQLPDPLELAAGSLVLVHETERPARGLRGLVSLWKRKRRAHPAVRCSALLARGYLDIGAAVDARSGERLAWGFAPNGNEAPQT
jgi:hypothetical protein